MGLSNSPIVEDSIIIPCEFCGVQLEEEVLFHHQVRVLGGPSPDPVSELEASTVRLLPRSSDYIPTWTGAHALFGKLTEVFSNLGLDIFSAFL
jgi:hypothetical protein